MAQAPTLRAEAAFALRSLGADVFSRVLCVPVRGETPEPIMRLLASVPASAAGPVLSVLVLAGEAHDAQALAKQHTRLSGWLAQALERIGQVTDLRRFYRTQAGAVLVVNRHGPGLCFRANEGLAGARKLAGDLALRTWYEGLLADEWLSFVDADLIVPHDFFIASKAASAVAVAHATRALGSSEQCASALSVRCDAYARAGGWSQDLLARLRGLGPIARSEGDSLVKAPALAANRAGTRTARYPGEAFPRRSALPR